MAMDIKQSGLRGLVGPAVHMECDAGVGQRVAGELDAGRLHGFLKGMHRLGIAGGNAFLEFVSANCSHTNPTAFGKFSGTPAQQRTPRSDLTG